MKWQEQTKYNIEGKKNNNNQPNKKNKTIKEKIGGRGLHIIPKWGIKKTSKIKYEM